MGGNIPVSPEASENYGEEVPSMDIPVSPEADEKGSENYSEEMYGGNIPVSPEADEKGSENYSEEVYGGNIPVSPEADEKGSENYSEVYGGNVSPEADETRHENDVENISVSGEGEKGNFLNQMENPKGEASGSWNDAIRSQVSKPVSPTDEPASSYGDYSEESLTP